MIVWHHRPRRARRAAARARLRTMLAAARRMASQHNGASGIEYALLAAMVAAIIGVFFLSIGLPIWPTFNALSNGLALG